MTDLKRIKKGYRVGAVLFDFDGTLTKPGHLDFPAIKREVGCPDSMPVLEFIEAMPDGDEKKHAMGILETHESEAAARSVPNDGARETLMLLRSLGIRTGIITRNSRKAVDTALGNFTGVDTATFDLIISRDTSVKPKPHEEGVVHAAKLLGISASDILVVGDYIFDIEAGNRAGSTTVFLTNGGEHRPDETDSHFIISNLGELENIVRMGLPLQSGKLPNDLLRLFLAEFKICDSSVIINPGIGEDCAAVDIEGEDILILKSDPITFTAESAGRYAVLVNANDIATSGAVPRWFLTTLLFPSGTTPSQIYEVIRDLFVIAESRHITLCGGHTEITDAVTRPIVSGMMAGLVARERLLEKKNMRSGDSIIMTKTAALEGTSILAREFAPELTEKGMSRGEIEEGLAYVGKISILEEAALAASFKGVRALHDVTEGGISTALAELASAGRHGIKVDMDAITRSDLTEWMCRLLGIDSLGLIGSGSLLICCDGKIAAPLMESLKSAGIGAACIGTVLGEGEGILAMQGGTEAQWPLFEVDELARLFREKAEADF
ncbi:MAG: hypothetical protein CVV44_19890 [Spirochaetae bacterium HGW-Spirochaetae-1]|jgi:HAD superfamily hydrolase (TIGR01509 family)|nr:MAG: hypothetical protein CVV44_19890 [Spirochaetae bacterium HGW-Spirochaetae-1]